ncbi:hypothetical protein BMS3Bbin11_01214 [bacterium BMS3Bbin11]|nr:hypothetical protein BMS3Bbin11_01214 [bacterium BMS3Bbin11]
MQHNRRYFVVREGYQEDITVVPCVVKYATPFNMVIGTYACAVWIAIDTNIGNTVVILGRTHQILQAKAVLDCCDYYTVRQEAFLHSRENLQYRSSIISRIGTKSSGILKHTNKEHRVIGLPGQFKAIEVGIYYVYIV